ncbi:hypothetical protein C8R44DRAFT_243308 [Mycena epipterygia]|nr:hypothetical protein C8R44DRAFT_243308 [Mycena epipterygia]
MPPVPQQHWQLAAQQPTCTNLRIRSVEDAHKIFYAVRKGVLRMVTRRLDSDERAALCTGCVYAWEERSPNTEITGLGIERFTEGRRWSASRVRDEFLFYYEKFVSSDNHRSGGGGAPPVNWEQLVKQTYSVWVDTGKGKRKWHLTAYFTQRTVDDLGTVDDIEDVCGLQVPEGMFTSTRIGKRKNTDSEAPQSTITRVYAPFPSPLVPLAPRPAKLAPPTSIGGRAPSPSLQMFDPYSRPQIQAQQLPFYGSVESEPYPPSPSTSQLPQLNYSYPPASHGFSMSSPVHNYPRHDGGDYRRSHPTTLAPPPAPTLTQPYNSHSAAPQYTGIFSNDRARLPLPNPSAIHYQGEQPHQPQPQQTSGGWYTPPTVPYTDRHGSPRSDYTSSSSSSSSYASSSSPPVSAYPPMQPYSEPGAYVSTSSGGNTRSLPRVQIPDDPHPAVPLDVGVQRRGEIGPWRNLAPLNSLTRGRPPYPRHPMDDNVLRLLPRPTP